MDLQSIVDTLVGTIEKAYKEDVALMCVYGSYIHRTAHAKSDVDFYFIPKTERGYALARTFIIGDIGFDFWPIPWERAERMADYAQGFVSLIADAQVVWYGREEDLSRFEALREKALHPQIDFDSRSKVLLAECEHLFAQIAAAKGLAAKKQLAKVFIEYMVETLAVFNHTYTHRGWKNGIQEAAAFAKRPEGLTERCEAILFARNAAAVTEHALDLLTAVKTILLPQAVSTAMAKDAFAGFYEEAKSVYNKLYHACETGDGLTAVMAGCYLQQSIIDMLGEEGYQARFQDIVGCFDRADIPAYAATVRQQEKQLCDFLQEEGIPVCRYADIEALVQDARL